MGEGTIYLMLHSVGGPADSSVPPGNWIHPDDFSHLCRALALINSRGGSGALCVPTFDDGYVDNYTTAAPILARFNLPGLFFVPTDLIGKSFATREGSVLPVMDRAMLEDLSRMGFAIGSHGHEHRFLTRLSSEELLGQLDRSRKILEDVTGQAVDTLSYPFGSVDDRVARAACEAGFKRGFSVDAVKVQNPDMAIQRIPVRGGRSAIKEGAALMLRSCPPVKSVMDILKDLLRPPCSL